MAMDEAKWHEFSTRPSRGGAHDHRRHDRDLLHGNGQRRRSGELIIEAGASLEFDDTSGCGFLSTSEAFTLTCTGTSTAWVTIKSANSYPDYRWTLPPAATTVVATRVQWRDYTGSFATAWILNNPSYITDAYIYATIEELENLTGTSATDDVIMEILAHSTRRINTRLASFGITIDVAGNRTLQSICLDFAVSQLITRYKLDGTAVGSINVDGFSSQPNLLDHIKYYNDRANEELEMYINANRASTYSRYKVVKVNG